MPAWERNEEGAHNIKLTAEHAASLIRRDFPAIHIERIATLGEGLGNVAFEVNDSLVFRFPKTAAHHLELQREIPLLTLVARYSTLPIPRPEFVAPAEAYVGYVKVEGTALIDTTSGFCAWRQFSEQMGEFLGAIHGIPIEELAAVPLNCDAESWEELRRDARTDYEKVRHLVPHQHFTSVESFFRSIPPTSAFEPVFCHNDLGIEHVLVTDSKISGVIDWGDTSITDPARDFGLIYRDLGPEILQQTLVTYSRHVRCQIDELRERAMFYGKCRVFEHIAYGFEENRAEYQKTGLNALDWLFPPE